MSDVQVTVTVGSQTLFSCSAISAVDALTTVIQQLQMALGHFQTQKPAPTAPTAPVAQILPPVSTLAAAPNEDAARRQAAGM